MSDDIQWVDAPPSSCRGTRRGKVIEFAAALRNRPGIWAQYGFEFGSRSSASATVLNIKWRGLEAVSRTVDGKHLVFARYVAPDASEQNNSSP